MGLCALAMALVFQLCCGPRTICPVSLSFCATHATSLAFISLWPLGSQPPCSTHCFVPLMPHLALRLSSHLALWSQPPCATQATPGLLASTPHPAVWSQPPCATHATPRPLAFTPHLAMWSWPLCATHPALFHPSALWSPPLCATHQFLHHWYRGTHRPCERWLSRSPGVSNFMCHPV